MKMVDVEFIPGEGANIKSITSIEYFMEQLQKQDFSAVKTAVMCWISDGNYHIILDTEDPYKAIGLVSTTLHHLQSRLCESIYPMADDADDDDEDEE